VAELGPAATPGLRWSRPRSGRSPIPSDPAPPTPEPLPGRAGRHLTRSPLTAAGIRTIAIPPHILDKLKAHLDLVSAAGPDGLVFPSPDGEPLCRSNFHRRSFQPAMAKAGLPEGFRFHDLRHTGNTLAASTGASTRELMARLGHASPRAALIYQHATVERDRLIADAISKVAVGSSKDDSVEKDHAGPVELFGGLMKDIDGAT